MNESGPTHAGGKPTRLRALGGQEVREGLVAAFEDILQYALDAADGEDRVRAIHEFRKSVRRARALLALCGELLPPRDRRQLRKLLRDAMAPTSRVRDRDVMPAILDELRLDEELAEVADTVQVELGNGSPAEAEVREALRSGRAHAEQAVEIFHRVLAAEVGWNDVEVGLSSSFKRARRALKRAIASGLGDDVHEWRKRTKELGYQLELFSSSEYAVAKRRQLSKLAGDLGEINDRIELVAHLREAGFRGGHRKRLAKKVIAELRAKARRAFSRGQLVYAQKGPEFAIEALRELRSA